MKKRGSLFFLIIVLLSCDKQEEQAIENSVKFKAQYETSSKTSNHFVNGTHTFIYTYSYNSLKVMSTMSAISTTGGTLSTTSPIYLKSGLYDFYSVSQNSPEPINIWFANGISGELYNGVDYLWACKKGVLINGGDNVLFRYKHIACMFSIHVLPSKNVSNLVVNTIKISYPITRGSSLNIVNGTINMSPSTSSPIEIFGFGNSRSTIILPCHSGIKIELNVNATIDGEWINNRIFTTTVNQELISGYSYSAELTISSEKHLSVVILTSGWKNVENNIPF